MSRIGRLPVRIPDGVELSRDGGRVVATGPRGEMGVTLPEGIAVEIDGGLVVVSRSDDSRDHRKMHGTTRAHIANIVKGVSEGHSKTLMVQGKGYQAEVTGRILEMQIGFSHRVVFRIPEGLEITVQPGQNAFTLQVKGNDRHLVGAFAAELYRLKPVEPYNLIGFRYSDQYVKRKTVKTIT